MRSSRPSFKLRTSRLIWLLCASLGSAAFPLSASAQTYLFNRADFATGVLPAAVAHGDFNGDHLPDLAVVNAVDNTLSILLGKPDGTFASQVTYATGHGPGFVAVGDLNRDGHLDLAITNQADNTVSILLGKGDGTFRAHVDYATDSNPRAVWICDLNHDGKPDVVVVDEICGPSPCNSGFISVFMGNGDGTLQTQKEYPTDASPLNLAVADVNGDGKLDVITTNFYPLSIGNDVSVLLGKGDGTFQPPMNFPTATGPESVAVADLNGDGKPDLAVVGGASSVVSVLLGNGDGTFQAHQEYSAGSAPFCVAIADFDGDGKPDIVAANNGGNSVSVLLGKGDGKFPAHVEYARSEE